MSTFKEAFSYTARHNVFQLALTSICVTHSVFATEVIPEIIAAPDGPLVHSTQEQIKIDINSPDAHHQGLSYNRYMQFHVDQRGVTFNNPDSIGARIILNEVIGTQASQLRGKLHVEGVRADVIVANPNGIECNGCSFSNVGWGILTTGTPQFNHGLLTGFQVDQGSVVVGNLGLRAYGPSKVDPTHIALLAESI